MLIKLDGKNHDMHEENFEVVTLRVHKNWGVAIDCNITPLFCMNCESQLPHFYYHGGSRYGQVGSVQCDFCGANINCVDNDNIVEQLYTYTDVPSEPKSRNLDINYYKLYKLEKDIWEKLDDKICYDIMEVHQGENISLETVLKEICQIAGLDFSNLPEITTIENDKRFKRLPSKINKWVSVLSYLKIL